MAEPYLIYRPSPGAGFFSNFFWILEHIDYADRHGHAPVVDMENHLTFFNESEPIEGSRNAWEYYFEQPGGRPLRDFAPDCLSCQGRKLGHFTRNRILGRRTRRRARDLVKRYVRPRHDILAELDRYLMRFDPGKSVGVHIRGTDMGLVEEHPIPRPPEYFLAKATAIFEKKGCSHVVLACDEELVVGLFKEAFGEKLVSQTAHRTAAGAAIGSDYGWLIDNPRPHHRYTLGREVLLDALLLASCRYLVCGWSNVANAAIAFASEDQRIIECPPVGIRKTGASLQTLRRWKFHASRYVDKILGR